mmetsp:Transcript_8698/g.13767  ORF Transcript_8698/g.13767 Transcript_8698/m.13767 type:complete len:187 (-) Transcript_8698:815-1375(-)
MQMLSRTLMALTLLAFCMLLAPPAADAKKKKVKTTFKALKCSACKAVADEMLAEVQHEWESKAGETILIEKRKKKTKVPYKESQLAVQEAVDRLCGQDHKFEKYNVTSISGKPEYVRGDKKVGNKEYKSQLVGMCQQLIAEHEPEIVKLFHTERDSKDLESMARANICSEISPYCSTEEFNKKSEL